MVPRETVSFVFPSFLRLGKYQDSGKHNLLVPRGTSKYTKYFVIYSDFPLNNHLAKTCCCIRVITALWYPSRDTLEFDQGHVTKNQPISVLVLSSEILRM